MKRDNSADHADVGVADHAQGSARRRFKTIPTPDQLREFDRDLRFYPCANPNPAMLTPQQIEAFNRDGCIIGLSIFDELEIAEHRSYFDRLLADVMARGGTSNSISSAHLKCGRVFDLMHDPRIVARVRDLLGNDIVGLASQFFCKMPHDPVTIAWHQDAAYWPLTPSKTVTVWLALEKADTANACMRFVAGSHEHGHLTSRASEAEENNLFSQTVPDAESYGRPVNVELAAGEISMHSDLLLHSSEANISDRRRCGLTLRYCTTDVRVMPGFGWAEEGVIISGHDPSGRWGNPARPAQDFVFNPDDAT
jgi:non-heme Fe2+,alpha-ketoglutarate-dependent halogenase